MTAISQSEPEVITFGCRLNAFESEVMRGHARAAGLTDAVIVNTCAVTTEAERQARQAIRRARRRRPDARIIVTGCAAQIDPARYADLPEVDQVLGNQDKLIAESYRDTTPAQITDIMTVRETAAHLLDGFGERARGFIQIQNGCDHRCTFCIIPFGRGNNRSVPQGAVVEAAHRMVDGGVRELVLTGVDIASYGGDLPGRPRLGRLVGRLLAAIPDLACLRLSSLDPAAIDDGLLDLLGSEPRLAPHLHLSVQAGDAMILKRMKRRHAPEDVADLCATVRSRRPDVSIGADLIAGFPTETDAMFANTENLVRDCGIGFAHVFPYSPRPGTPAARMPQVEPAIRRQRAAALRAAGDDQLRRYLDRLVGQTADVLVEQPGQARSAHYARVAVPDDLAVGDLHQVRLAARDDTALIGIPP